MATSTRAYTFPLTKKDAVKNGKRGNKSRVSRIRLEKVWREMEEELWKTKRN